VTVPAAALTGPIAVTSAGGTTSSSTFTVDPKITSFTPTSAAGAPVTITGSGFGLGADTRVVKVGPVTATNVTYVSPTSLKFVVPNGAALSDKIHVQVNGGVIADSLTNLNVTATIVSRRTGRLASPVTITGTGFTGATAVKFNGQPAASFHVDSTTQISAIVPTGTTPGPITILRSAAPTTITSATNFANESSITLFSPTSAHAGDQIVITGTELQTASLVTFAGASATAVPLSASASSVSVDVPANAQGGSITVHTALGDAPFT
jgi:IPT/TIG domain